MNNEEKIKIIQEAKDLLNRIWEEAVDLTEEQEYGLNGVISDLGILKKKFQFDNQ